MPARSRIFSRNADSSRFGRRFRSTGAEPPADQHVVGLAELAGDVFLQVVADVIGLPLRSGEEVLQAVGRRVAGLFGRLPAVLASDWSE
jgi:hypothetical protein